LADKPTQLVLDALSRAVGEPSGLPLVAGKNAPGLFPASPAARQAAQRCRDDNLLRVVGADTRGKAAQELYAISDAGLAFLLDQAHPRTVLEDLVRAVEARERQVGDLVTAARQAQSSLEAIRAVAERVLTAVQSASPPNGVAHSNGVAPPDSQEEGAVLAELAAWRGPGDYPLPQLYRRATPNATIGRFHDVLRRLNEGQQIHLHPWPGPLYDLPEPAFALLAGHAVSYYASKRVASG
jgi:hypothetical protein